MVEISKEVQLLLITCLRLWTVASCIRLGSNGLILSGADMPQAGKGNVGGGDPHSLLDGLGEDRLAYRLSLLWIGVVFDGNGGIGKMDSGDVDDVTPERSAWPLLSTM